MITGGRRRAGLKPPSEPWPITMREQRIQFRILYKGRSFICSRTVTGIRKLRQTVTVPGFGVEIDLAIYSQHNVHPISSMEDAAIGIATQMVARASHPRTARRRSAYAPRRSCFHGDSNRGRMRAAFR